MYVILKNMGSFESENPTRRKVLKQIVTLGAIALVSPVLGKEKLLPKEKSVDSVEQQQFIAVQIKKIKDIIENKMYAQILTNPYLASAIYYSQSFLKEISHPKKIHVSEKIIGAIFHLITPEFRAQAILEFEKQTKDREVLENKKISKTEKPPLEYFNFDYKKNHQDAIDLFTAELAPVSAMASGLVILADNNWRPNDELSSTSDNGGNTVIIFNYLTREFYRYAHFHKVNVQTGDLVMEGRKIGTVGHTGKNASKVGHGQHLHLEINKFLNDKTNKSLTLKELKNRLKKPIR